MANDAITTYLARGTDDPRFLTWIAALSRMPPGLALLAEAASIADAMVSASETRLPHPGFGRGRPSTRPGGRRPTGAPRVPGPERPSDDGEG